MGRLLPFHTSDSQFAYTTPSEAAANAPMVALVYGGYMPLARSGEAGPMSNKGSNGLNIVAAILVTASSMMVLLALRLWICKCSCLMRYRSNGNDNSGADMEDGVKKSLHTGLKKEVISKFDLVDYKALSGSQYDKICTVCLCDFTCKDVQIRLLPGCNHSFHPACIEMWLFSHNSCPICRKSLVDMPKQDQQACGV